MIADKNNKLSKDLSTTEEVSIKIRLFNFFYYVLRKKDINLFICSLFIFLETLQLISYAFSEPFITMWKISSSTMDYIKVIVPATRVAPLMTLLSFNWYIVIYGCLAGLIFLQMLFFAMTLRINKVNSKFYQTYVSFTRYVASLMTIFLLIPFSELILMVLKCDSSGVSGFNNSLECWKGLHFLYIFISIISSITFFFFIIILAIFYFDPFNSKKTATKIDTTADTFLLIFKILSVIRFVALNSQWISIVFMVIFSLLNLKRSYEYPTYNNNLLECFISIRNASIFWTYFVLLISMILSNSNFNGQIFLLLVGYPLTIMFSITYFRRTNKNFSISTSNFNDANEFLIKLKYLKHLIESFLSKNKSSKSNKSNNLKKDEILLKGYITIHEETCTIEECPLKKFLEDNGNFALQKVSLLHYMNMMFTEGIKKFPNSKIIIMNFVQFNYEKKYNLNSAKTYLAKLDKSHNTMTEEFIINSMKQNISNNSSSNKVNRTFTNDDDILRIEDTTEHKFKKLRTLIETASKLYGELWGSLSTNLTNNLNLKKLFFVGNKLNLILSEINNLWENNLKNKKIDIENQSIVQLYSYFLKEIMKNKKKSDEVSKRINEEQYNENRKTDGDKFDIENIDIILENQDLVIYSRATEKGEVSVIQCSNSVIALLGYSKQELIGQNVETLMPSIYIEDHARMISSRIKNMRASFNVHKDAFKSAVEKKQIFILPKNKTGYLTPINTRFSVYNDDDFSNAYIVKSKFELKDTKSVYAFYILTREDFTIDSISSSCLNLNLSMELLKKYIVNINYLIRSETFSEIDFSIRYQEYEEEPCKVYWVYPDILYPKNEIFDLSIKNDEEREQLINDSKRQQFNLLINRVRYKENETLGYSFRLTSIQQPGHGVETFDLKPYFNKKKSFMYNMKKLSYMRASLVTYKKDKSSKDLLTPEGIDIGLVDKKNVRDTKKERTRKRRDSHEFVSDSEEEVKTIEENILTKAKISEYQTKTAEEIKNFINGLKFFGEGISLFKRDLADLRNVTEDHYNKIPLIKQSLDDFNKKMVNLKKLDKKIENRSSVNLVRDTESTIAVTSDITSNSDYISDTSSSLNNIFSENSVTNIKYFSFIMFLALCIITTVEFAFSLSIIQNSNNRMFYSQKAFDILNSLLYTKFFITEAILSQNSSYTNIDKVFAGNNTQSIINQMGEMSNYRQIISGTYTYFSNSSVTFSDEYYQFVNNQAVYIRTLSNGLPSVIVNSFPIAITRIPTTIFYVSTVSENFNQINMSNRNAYELMMNLLNDYLIVWLNLTKILVNDLKGQINSDNRLWIIFMLSFVISTISVFVIRLLINKFIDDREKPVDLFLTIKRQKFEELKSSSEAFLNKLLNKFFGNEETEDDDDDDKSFDNTIKMKSDDINIAKFKQKNEYKQSIRTSSEYFLILLRIFIFFLIYQVYMTFKYFYITTGMKNMDHFTDVFNATQFSQSDLIYSLNVAKQFYYNKKIPIFNNTNTEEVFKDNIITISDEFENMIKTTYLNTNYLGDNYLQQFMLNLNGNITQLYNSSSYINQTSNILLLETLNYVKYLYMT